MGQSSKKACLNAKAEAEEQAELERQQSLRTLEQKLIEQVTEANKERHSMETSLTELESERETLRVRLGRMQQEVRDSMHELDEFSEAEGDARREMKRWQERASFLERQLQALERESINLSENSEEAERNLEAAREVQRRVEERVELADWKLRIAATQLTTRNVNPMMRALTSQAHAGLHPAPMSTLGSRQILEGAEASEGPDADTTDAASEAAPSDAGTDGVSTTAESIHEFNHEEFCFDAWSPD